MTRAVHEEGIIGYHKYKQYKTRAQLKRRTYPHASHINRPISPTSAVQASITFDLSLDAPPVNCNAVPLPLTNAEAVALGVIVVAFLVANC